MSIDRPLRRPARAHERIDLQAVVALESPNAVEHGVVGAMPTTVDAAFNHLALNLSTSKAETQAAASHRASVQQCLQANYGITGFFLSGSFGNGTNISGYSDADRFAIFPANRLHQDSARSLAEIAEVLRRRFSSTGVRVDAPGILAEKAGCSSVSSQ